MRVIFAFSAVTLLVSVSACAPQPRNMVTTNAPSASAQMPQSVNSLPGGSTVNAPVATDRGNVGTTAVGRRY